MLRPGAGCVGAPRCFSLKLATAVIDRLGANPVTYDDQVLFRHNRQCVLEFIATIHVGDIKAACPGRTHREFVKVLEQVFGSGELVTTHDNFTNCGVRHTLTPTGYELDQTEYLKALMPIQHVDLTGKPADQPAAPYVQQFFHSLVMAVAYTLITRVDLCIYCVALQRVAAAPTNLHARRLNALVRWAQKNPLTIKYSKHEMRPSSTHIHRRRLQT